MALSEFDFEIKYRKGSKNDNADSLSRTVIQSHNDTQKVFVVEPLVFPTREDFIAKQLEDPLLSRVIAHLRSEDKEAESDVEELLSAGGVFSLEAETGRLMHSEQDQYPVVVVPAALRSLILYLYHDAPLAGHFAKEKTYRTARKHVFWNGMQKDIAEYTESAHYWNLFKDSER
jgi:hypothetical protein